MCVAARVKLKPLSKSTGNSTVILVERESAVHALNHGRGCAEGRSQHADRSPACSERLVVLHTVHHHVHLFLPLFFAGSEMTVLRGSCLLTQERAHDLHRTRGSTSIYTGFTNRHDESKGAGEMAAEVEVKEGLLPHQNYINL